MRGRTVVKLAASIAVAIAGIVLMAAPASAGTNIRVAQPATGGGEAGWAKFVHDSGAYYCRDAEEVQAYDYSGGFGIEAQLYWRAYPTLDWQWKTTVRTNDGPASKCIDLPEGVEVKLSVWKYNAGDRWDRKSGYASA